MNVSFLFFRLTSSSSRRRRRLKKERLQEEKTLMRTYANEAGNVKLA